MNHPPARCVAPQCSLASVEGAFCAEHVKAPRGQRGGWLSAARRRPAYNASQVSPRLWVGGSPPLDRDLPGIEILTLAAAEIQPDDLTFSGRIMRCPLPEGDLSVARLRMLALCAVTVAQAVRNGRRVLVTSHKGTGRSALIAGVALGQLTTMGAREIIELIRARRPGALQDARLCAIIEKLVGSGRPKAKRGRILRRSD